MTEHACLHCAIRDAILNHFESIGDMHGNTVVVDAKKVIDALSRITAETLASINDDELRESGLIVLVGKVVREVSDIRARGEQGEEIRLS